MASNRGGGSKRSTVAAPAAPVNAGVAHKMDVGVAAAAASTQAAIQQAGQPMDEEYYEKQRERMALERETDFKRSEHSLRNRIHDSGYVWFDLPSENETYVGHIDDFTESMKRHKGTHINLTRRAPVKGTKIVWKGGEPIFFLQEDHGDWGSVVNPESHEPLIPAKADPKKTKDRRVMAGLDKPMTELERVNQPGFDAEAENKKATKKASSKKGSAKKSSSKKSASKTAEKKIETQTATEKQGDGSHPVDTSPMHTGG